MRRPSSIVTLLAALGSLSTALADCASSGNQPPDLPSTTQRIVSTSQERSRGGVIQTTDINARTEIRVHASSGSVMAALSQVYPDLGIPIGTAIAASGQIGNQNYRVPGHRLKSTQLSQILECGQESVTGSRADLDEITIDVLSTIKSEGDTASVVSTFLTASARPLGSSSDAVTCQTNGRLEQMISAHLQQSLGAP